MIFKASTIVILALGLSTLLAAPTSAHFFWVNVCKDCGEIEVTFSEKAGVPDAVIQKLKDKIETSFSLKAMGLTGEGHRPSLKSIDWSLEDDRIVGVLPKMEASSVIVSGHFDVGPFSEHGIDVDDLQQHFSSDQLLNKNTPMKVAAHEHMKEKPFYVELVACGSEVVAKVHGLSGSTDTTPVSVCLYQKGGEQIGCQDAEAKDDDVAIARLATSFESTTTIFAKAHAMFPSSGGKGTAKYVTVSADYTPECTY